MKQFMSRTWWRVPVLINPRWYSFSGRFWSTGACRKPGLEDLPPSPIKRPVARGDEFAKHLKDLRRLKKAVVGSSPARGQRTEGDERYNVLDCRIGSRLHPLPPTEGAIQGKHRVARNEGGDGKRPEPPLVTLSKLAVVRVSRRVRPLPEVPRCRAVTLGIARLAIVPGPISLPTPIVPIAPAESDRQ